MQVVLTSGDWVMLHSPEVTQKYIKSNFKFFFSFIILMLNQVMMHFPVAAALAGALDDWGQVSDCLHQPP